ncbi:hypothetical protein [Kribbella sp. NPDC006257]|uniref:hypothetical protein n=1 Tax=Kribbella sp. NPDC006257 TaxID=3156738 RepID=UPI0033A161E1
MTSNAEARLTEAKDRAWLGEVAALEESLKLHRMGKLQSGWPEKIGRQFAHTASVCGSRRRH